MIDFVTSAGNAIADLDAYQAALDKAKNTISQASGGLERTLLGAALQLDRFVAANIQVDTGRTKNSIFIASSKEGSNGVSVGLFSNVSYSLYVGHKPNRSSEQFFSYAARVEAPKALNTAARGLAQDIEKGFL